VFVLVGRTAERLFIEFAAPSSDVRVEPKDHAALIEVEDYARRLPESRPEPRRLAVVTGLAKFLAAVTTRIRGLH
jgi:hypothetical protein